jgi:acyl carrier protein
MPESVLSDLGVTSLDLVEVIMTIEDEYDVTIAVDAVDAWNNYKVTAQVGS